MEQGGNVYTASAWKALRKTVALALPSGMTIEARRPDAAQLAMWDKVPLGLLSQAGAAQLSDEQTEELARYMRELLMFCCVRPRISLDPKSEEEIHPREIPEGDWQFIVRWALRAEEAAALAGFRGRGNGAESGSGGEGVGMQAQRDAGDSGSGAGIGTGRSDRGADVERGGR